MSQIRQFKPNEVDTICGIVDSCGASPMDVIKAIKASNVLRGHPGAILGQAKKAGLIIKNRDGTYSVPSSVINEKGGETIKVQIPEENLTDVEYLKRHGKAYHGKTIIFEEKDIYGITINQYTKDIWGIGDLAITVVDKIITTNNGRNYEGKQHFHSFVGWENNQTTPDGEKVAEMIIQQLGRLKEEEVKPLPKKPLTAKVEKPSSKTLTKEDEELYNFILENKFSYIGKTIRGLDIWGIGKYAITIGNIKTGDGYGCGTPNRWCDKKQFHNFFGKKIKNSNSFDDGLELAKEIIQEYGRIQWGIEQTEEAGE